jgi:hypothetical protein
VKFSKSIESAYLDLKALARYSSISIRTLRKILANPAGPPHYRPGGKLLVRKSDFDAWMAQFRREPVDLDSLVEEVLAEFQRRKS